MNDTLATLEAMLRQACAEHAECLEAAVNFELAQEQAQGDLRNAECLEEDARARAKALGEAVAAGGRTGRALPLAPPRRWPASGALRCEGMRRSEPSLPSISTRPPARRRRRLQTRFAPCPVARPWAGSVRRTST